MDYGNTADKKTTTPLSAENNNSKVSRNSNVLTTRKSLNKRDNPAVKALGNKARNRNNDLKANRHHILRIADSEVNNNKRKGDEPKGAQPGFTFGAKKKSIPRKRRRSSLSKGVLDSEILDNCASSTIIDDWIPDVSHMLQSASVVAKEDMKHSKKSKQQTFSNCVQLHGLPKNSSLNSIRRFFSGLPILRVVILLPSIGNDLRIVEWDPKHEYEFSRKSCKKVGKNDIVHQRIERCNPSVRVWVQFDSTPTARLACERSNEHITTRMHASQTLLLRKTSRKSTSKKEVAIDHSSHNYDEQKQFEVAAPSITLAKAAVAVIPVTSKRVAKYVMNNVAIDTRHIIGFKIMDDGEDRITNEMSIETIQAWIERQLDATVAKIMWSATVQELNLTAQFDTHNSGAIHKDPCAMFPLFHNQISRKKEHWKSREKISTKDELNEIRNHCTFLEATLDKIESRNRTLLLVSLDISDNNPLIAILRATIQVLSKQIEYLKYKMTLSQRMEHIVIENKSFASIK
jgi:hypothetical protein